MGPEKSQCGIIDWKVGRGDEGHSVKAVCKTKQAVLDKTAVQE